MGLDVEALYWEDTGMLPWQRLVLCVGWGYRDDLSYFQAVDMRPGVFDVSDLKRLRADLTRADQYVVAHNANFDLDIVNGLLDYYNIDPLPELPFQDTMGKLKNGRVGRKTLDDLCSRYLGRRKAEHPDWRSVIMGSPEAWAAMQEYNLQDVRDTLDLAEAREREDVPIRMWKPRR